MARGDDKVAWGREPLGGGPKQLGQSVPNYDVNGAPVGATLADGDYGDVVVSDSGATMEFDPAAVTAYARTVLQAADAAAARAVLAAQLAHAILDGLSGMGTSTGLVEQTGAAAFAKRAIGAASATDILSRAAGDGRYLLSTSYTAADVLSKLLTVDGAGSGLDADTLDGQSSAAFAPAAHTHAFTDVVAVPTSRLLGRVTAGTGAAEALTGAQATSLLDLATGGLKGLMSSADFTKLGGVATGATANSSDAFLLARANHTGSQLAATISDFNASADARIAAAVGSTVAAPADVQIFTANGTWNKPAGAKTIHVFCLSGGGGGGSGRKGAAGTVRCGGGGGAGGQLAFAQIPAVAVGASEVVVVGAGGAGGASQTTNSTNGNNGGLGGNSSFGSLVKSLVAVFGFGGTATAGTGGAVTAGAMNLPGTGAAADPAGGAGIGGTRSFFMSGSGGGSGGGIGVGNVAVVGGAGGGDSVAISGLSGVGGGGAGGGVGLPGTTPAARTTGDTRGGQGGGGGGSSTTTDAGSGAAGQFPGGGGGGGGASVDGLGNSGAGGNGGAGCVIVITLF